ncbi:LmbU family transcriptional regulator [Streptomyces sp. NPDC057963]|uniref:LmbU family transcriptional regulator n=1 Tax=Streptomyces sp. NPDC057963 TaxID=3346290 RepID=UPI0036E05CBD
MDSTTDVQDAKVVWAHRSTASILRRQRKGGERPAHGQVLTTRVGLEIPVDLTFEDWERAGQQLASVVNSSVWWLGDWLVHGRDNFSDRYKRGVREAGLSYQTLRNYAWVSRRFELSRRRPCLSFQHHAEVASLSVPEQELFLDRSEQMRWNTKQLRSAIRDAHEDVSGCGKKASEVQRLAVPANRLQWWREAAEESGIDFEKWVLETLDGAAGQALDEADGIEGAEGASDIVDELAALRP